MSQDWDAGPLAWTGSCTRSGWWLAGGCLAWPFCKPGAVSGVCGLPGEDGCPSSVHVRTPAVARPRWAIMVHGLCPDGARRKGSMPGADPCTLAVDWTWAMGMGMALAGRCRKPGVSHTGNCLQSLALPGLDMAPNTQTHEYMSLRLRVATVRPTSSLLRPGRSFLAQPPPFVSFSSPTSLSFFWPACLPRCAYPFFKSRRSFLRFHFYPKPLATNLSSHIIPNPFPTCRHVLAHTRSSSTLICLIQVPAAPQLPLGSSRFDPFLPLHPPQLVLCLPCLSELSTPHKTNMSWSHMVSHLRLDMSSPMSSCWPQSFAPGSASFLLVSMPCLAVCSWQYTC